MCFYFGRLVIKYKSDLLVEMRCAPAAGGPPGGGGADPGPRPAVLPRDADRAAHGAQSRPAVQAEDHQRLLPPVRRTGGTSTTL